MTTEHIYQVGQVVDLLPVASSVLSKATLGWTVKARLPHRGDELQYRIKSEAEPYERVVLERDLIFRARVVPLRDEDAFRASEVQLRSEDAFRALYRSGAG